jgi:hypothetical protein
MEGSTRPQSCFSSSPPEDTVRSSLEGVIRRITRYDIDYDGRKDQWWCLLIGEQVLWAKVEHSSTGESTAEFCLLRPGDWVKLEIIRYGRLDAKAKFRIGIKVRDPEILLISEIRWSDAPN